LERRLTTINASVVVDRSRGDKMVEDSRRHLAELSAPDVIVMSTEFQLGNVAYIELSYSDWPEQCVFAYAYEPWIETGMIFKIRGPFDINLLVHAANDVAAALDYELELMTDYGSSCSFRSAPSTTSDPRGTLPVAPYFHGESASIPKSQLTNWQRTLGEAVIRWLAAHSTGPRPNSLFSINPLPPSPQTFAQQFVRIINSISPVEAAWRVETDHPSIEHYILIHERWATELSLSSLVG